jgi:hypothetical protein
MTRRQGGFQAFSYRGCAVAIGNDDRNQVFHDRMPKEERFIPLRAGDPLAGCGNPELSEPTLPYSDLLQNDAYTSFSSISNHC